MTRIRGVVSRGKGEKDEAIENRGGLLPTRMDVLLGTVFQNHRGHVLLGCIHDIF